MSLINEALLAVLNIRKWSGRRFDLDASNWVNAKYNADKDAARVNKRVVPKSFLAPIESVTVRARNTLKGVTLPWLDNGARMLPAISYFDVLTDIGVIRSAFDQEVRNLLDVYEPMKAASKLMLGGMYDEATFPTPDELRSKFSMELTCPPLPSASDFRITSITNTEQMVDEYEKTMASVITNTRTFLVDKLCGTVAMSLHKLRTLKRIHPVVLTDILTACADTQKLNVIKDPLIKDTAVELQRKVSTIDIKWLRKNKEEAILFLEECAALVNVLQGDSNVYTSTGDDENIEYPVFGSKTTNDQGPNKVNSTSPFFRSFSA